MWYGVVVAVVLGLAVVALLVKQSQRAGAFKRASEDAQESVDAIIESEQRADGVRSGGLPSDADQLAALRERRARRKT